METLASYANLVLFFLQLMDSGASGNSGLNAQELVAVEFKHVPARAQDPAPPTVEKIVSGAEMRQGHVVPTLAQVKRIKKCLICVK